MSDQERPGEEGEGAPSDELEVPAPSAAPPPTAAAPSPHKSADERKAALARAIQAEVVQGARVESQQDYQAVLVFGKAINHILHLIITLVTCLIWGLVWIALVIFGGEKRVMVVIDEYGNVLRQKL